MIIVPCLQLDLGFKRPSFNAPSNTGEAKFPCLPVFSLSGSTKPWHILILTQLSLSNLAYQTVLSKLCLTRLAAHELFIFLLCPAAQEDTGFISDLTRLKPCLLKSLSRINSARQFAQYTQYAPHTNVLSLPSWVQRFQAPVNQSFTSRLQP